MVLQRILTLSILSLLACFSLITNAYSDGPKAVLLEKDHYFGRAWQGDTVRHTFKLKNIGDGELRIENLEITGIFTTIKCKKIIQPGQEEEITLLLNTDQLQGEVETGATLYTNDVGNAKIELKMRGRVNPVINIQPIAAMFFSPYKGQSPEKYVTIINYYDQPLTITKVEYQSNRFQAQLDTIKEGWEYRLLAKVNPKAATGRTMEKVTLFTNNDKMPKFDIGVNIFIRDDVYNFPDDINFGTIDLENLRKNPQLLDLLIQTILVKRREGKGSDFQIKLEYNIPFINVKKEPESGSETYRLDISLVLDKMTKGKIGTFIRVRTNDKEVPEIKIPVIGEVI